MRILVTGAGGFAGRHLLAELERVGNHEILAGGYGEPLVPGAGDVKDSNTRWVSLDITSSDSIRAAIRMSMPDQVYHLAGQASVGQSFRAPEETWEINATGTLRLLQALQDEGCTATRVLLVSSAEVYGAVEHGDQPIGEAVAMRPVTPYGASKAAAEMLGYQYAHSGALQVVIARSFNHIGPGQDGRFVLPSFARQLVEVRKGRAEPVLRVGNLDVGRDFLDVRDVVRAYVMLMERGQIGEPYNVCSGQLASLEEVVLRLVALSGASVEIVADPDRVRPVDIPALVGDSGRLRALGWAPAFSLDETLLDLLSEVEAGSAA